MPDRFARFLAVFACALAVAGSPACADEQTVNAIIKSLAPIAGQTVSPGYGSDAPPISSDIRRPLHVDRRPVRVLIDKRVIILDYRHSLDFTIYFAYDSAHLTPRARRELSVLGEALQSPALSRFTYLIAGHTDARGPDAYNVDLSYQRAWAVKRFLIRNFSIAPWRLQAIGWGERYLRDPTHAFDGINRRVEVTLIDRKSAPEVGVLDSQTAPDIGKAPPKVIIVAPPRSNAEAADLPPCPVAVIGQNRPDLDDFTPQPSIDCDPGLPPAGRMIVNPDGRVIFQN